MRTLIALTVFGGGVAQATVAPALRIGDIAPDLPLIVVVLLALRRGPELGCVAGFAAGLLQDVTGGGLIDNIPRILPLNCDAIIETKNWRGPRIFKILQQNGRIDVREMYRVFNMGIGMVAVIAEENAQRVISRLKAKRIGHIVRGSGKVRLQF